MPFPRVTLKDRMIIEIADYGWLDYAWERGDNEAEVWKGHPQGYRYWLQGLDDGTFLSTYNRVIQAQRELD